MNDNNEPPISHVDRKMAAKINQPIEATTEDGSLAVSTPKEPPIEEPPPEESPSEEPPPEEPP